MTNTGQIPKHTVRLNKNFGHENENEYPDPYIDITQLENKEETVEEGSGDPGLPEIPRNA
jgi:hypothetical protein